MLRKSLDLIIVIAITLIAVIMAFVLPADYVPGRILALPLVLVLPGYALTALLFPRSRLGMAERLLLILVMSLALTILSGLLLNLLPYGLQTRSWAVALGSLTLVISLVALGRRDYDEEIPSTTLLPRFKSLNLSSGILLGLAAIVVGIAFTLSISGAAQQRYNGGATQLWLLPGTNNAHAYNLRLGVNNMQPEDMQYDLTVSVNGTTVEHWSSLQLKSKKQWLSNLSVPKNGRMLPEHVEAVLNRSGAPTERYRYVDLWLGLQS